MKPYFSPMEKNLEALRYPVGRFDWSQEVNPEDIPLAVQTIVSFPEKLRMTLGDLGDISPDTPYRPEGWTIRQVVHHCADSHMQAYSRFKMALTETQPTIKPYDQDAWAQMADSQMDMDVSLTLLEAIHLRWKVVLQSMTPDHWLLGYIHPEHMRFISLRQAVMQYAWHCEHHLGHIRGVIPEDR